MKITKVSGSITMIDHESAVAYLSTVTDPERMSIEEVIRRITALNDGICRFWNTATNWASIEAAHLLSISRLDRQVSLTRCLQLWVHPSQGGDADGHLILAWTNLGSLVEGSLKLFLSVWYESYKNDVDAIRKHGKLQDPDGLQLELLRQFFRKRIWDAPFDRLIAHIQQRRNAIHAYKDRDIGTYEQYWTNVRVYLQLVRYINFRIPYPADEYVSQER